jgi:hypothetical protein
MQGAQVIYLASLLAGTPSLLGPVCDIKVVPAGEQRGVLFGLSSRYVSSGTGNDWKGREIFQTW